MKLTLIACATVLTITGCSTKLDYACGKNQNSPGCQSLSQTAKETSHALPTKAIAISEKTEKKKIFINIPKPKQGTYTYAGNDKDTVIVENRVDIIPSKSTNKRSDMVDITEKQAVIHTKIDFENDVKNIRSGGVQSNNKLAYVNAGTPLLTEPWVVNIYFTPHVNSYGDLDTGGNVYMKIQDSEWVLQR